MLNKFFMYGTLKKNHHFDHKFLSDHRTSVQNATIRGDIFNLGSYPTIKLDGKGLVVGEIHTFPEECLEQIRSTLDHIEGYSKSNPEKGLYNRHKVQATLKNGEMVEVWVYEYNGDVNPNWKIESGEWSSEM